MIDTSGHHIVYGTLHDFLTGEELPDTDDERYRQQLARFLVQEKGYAAGELQPRLTVETQFNNQFVRSVIELTVRMADRRVMLVRYGPGSLVTRERPAIAAARILDPAYRIPLAVVTNCRDAELLDTGTGKVLDSGMGGIPDREKLAGMLATLQFEPFVDEHAREREARILNVFDVEVCCRNNSCELPPDGGGTDKNT
ncbi:MAG: type I restriction enzyme HsdR N-terminal domain-containing protein [Desulfobulbaceae bacterium]|nr:type I restriction enzyme HsdR N-terminal domain-containing protein [Desulfobulbaceae bacterium]